MIHRPGTVTLSPEEATRYDDDERANLRSWGIIVPEPPPYDPSDEPPIEPTILPPSYYRNPRPNPYQRPPMVTSSSYAVHRTAWRTAEFIGTSSIETV